MSQIPFARPNFACLIAAAVAPDAKSVIGKLVADAETSLSSMRIYACRKGLFAKRCHEGVSLRKFWKIAQAAGGAQVCVDWAARLAVLLKDRSNIHWIGRRNPESGRFFTITCRSKPTTLDRQATNILQMALLDLEWERRKKLAEKNAKTEAKPTEQEEACASDSTKNCA